jgi:hypothetical protein
VAKVRAGTIAILVVSLPVLVGVFVYGPFVADLFLHRRPPSRFLIPSGYVGWVRVEYRVAGALPLPREGKYVVVRVGRDGTARTSSDLPEGWARDQFFSYSGNQRQTLSNAGWCKGGMIWGEVIDHSSGESGGSSFLRKFFVGSEDQFRIEVDPAGRTYSPCG